MTEFSATIPKVDGLWSLLGAILWFLLGCIAVICGTAFAALLVLVSPILVPLMLLAFWILGKM